MGAVDKVALGTAGILGIRKDLGLVGQQFSCELHCTHRYGLELTKRGFLVDLFWSTHLGFSGTVCKPAR